MIEFACDWCKRLKEPEEVWILGYAAEAIGVTSARREMNVSSSWDRERAVHPLAVHFCSEEHKDNYIAAYFQVQPAETVVRTETVIDESVPAEMVVMPAARRKPAKRTTTAKKTRRRSA